MVFMLGILCLFFNMQISLNALLFPPPGLSTTEDDFWRGQSRANVNNAGRWGPTSPGTMDLQFFSNNKFQKRGLEHYPLMLREPWLPGAIHQRRRSCAEGLQLM